MKRDCQAITFRINELPKVKIKYSKAKMKSRENKYIPNFVNEKGV
jgi:hypothetical protein